MSALISFGSGGTGGTECSSGASGGAAKVAARSRIYAASGEESLMSLPALFLLTLLCDCRLDATETEVALVVAERDAESRELAVVVGVLAYVVEDAELRLGVKLCLVCELPCFFADLSGEGELY